MKKIPEGWKEVELGEITECLDEKRIPLNEEERKKIPGDIPYYGANGQVDLINKFIFNEELLLLAEDGGSWGPNQKCAYIIKGKSWVNNHAHVLRVKKERANILFLKYWLNKHDLNKFISGTTRGKLNQKAMNKIKIPLPPLPIQKQIVSILEKAEKLKQKREDADKLTDEYLKSVFYEMFGDPIKNNKNFPSDTLKNICSNKKNSLKRGPFGGSLKKEIFVKKGYKVYEQQNAIYDDMTLGEYFITQEKYDEMIDFAVQPGDFIISCSGTMGKIALIPKDAPKGIINQALLKITLNKDKINSTYFKFLFQSNRIQDHLFSISRGSGISNFPPMSEIRNLKIILPPIKEQQKFASIVEHIEKLKEKQKQSKIEINQMFDSLMKQAFNGELVR